MLNGFFHIKKISDLMRLCVLPVMILALFLAFYLYLDMDKIGEKSQELVDNAVPHVLATQDRAISLVELQRNIERMSSSPDLQQARKAYVDTHTLLTEALSSQDVYLQQQGSKILRNINRLWKLRLQLDTVRNTVNSSLSYMDTIMYMLYNQQPELFPEIKDHVNNYLELYQINSPVRNFLKIHEQFYFTLCERLARQFDREEFIKKVRQAASPLLKDGSESKVGSVSEVSAAMAGHQCSNEHEEHLLSLYKAELDRFGGIWELFNKLQVIFIYDVAHLNTEVDELSQSYTAGESSELYEELSDISRLADETKPMVMMTIGFCLFSFALVVALLSRFILVPLKHIAHILIVFRHTKRARLDQYTDFLKKDHLLEIREILDVLPQIFDDYSTIQKQSCALSMRYEELLNISRYDDLSKVYNRSALNMLMREIGVNTPERFATLMVDIDFFKSLNDSMGHQRGDEVLFAVAQTLQLNVSKNDLVFRYGGEEFCVILFDVSPNNALQVAERLCTTIKEMKLINEGVKCGYVTVSIGVSLVTTTKGQFKVEELISQADKALYMAKKGGRDQVVVCPEDVAFNTTEIKDAE